MMVMTAKVDIKKIAIVLAAAAGLILAVILLFGGNKDSVSTAATVSSNDSRVDFLENFGWDVTTSPTESGKVRIPEEAGDVFSRYNTLQKSQGYDLSNFAGQTVMRYVYQVNNFPGATEPVYATLLVHKNQVIGGDITDTSAKGAIRSFTMPEATQSTTQTTEPSTVPSTAE